MITIWKYPISLVGEFELEMPEGACILSVQMQGDQAQMWALVNTERPRKKFAFKLVGTGHPLEHTTPWGHNFETHDWIFDYRGTFQVGRYVFHLFMMPPHAGAE